MISLRTFLLLVLANYAMTQALNRCVPFFKDEKVGFDLVGLDKTDNVEILMPTVTDATNGRQIIGAKVFFRVCSSMKNLPPSCKEVNEATAYYIENGICRPLNSLASTINRRL